MAVEVAVFTPKPPVSLFESARQQVGTTYQTLIQPTLYAEVDNLGQVQRLRNTTAVLTALRLHNSSASARTVDFQVRSSRRVTYQAEVTAAAGENWLRLERTTSVAPFSVLNFDWTQTQPARITPDIDAPSNPFDVSWTSDSKYLAVVYNQLFFDVFDRDNAFARIYRSPSASSPISIRFCAWQPGSRLLALAYENAQFSDSVFVRVFDFDDINSPVEITLSGITSSVTQTPNSLTWGGPDGRYLLIAQGGTARVVAYDFDTPASPSVASGLGTALSDATAGSAFSIAASGATLSDRLAIAHSGGDRLTVFSWPSATTVSKISDAAFVSNSVAGLLRPKGLSWSSDGRYLASLLTPDASTPFTVYDFDGGVSVRPAPAPLPFAPPLQCVALSADGSDVVLGHSEAIRFTYYPVSLTYLFLYRYQSGTPARVPPFSGFQGTGTIFSLAFSPDGEVLSAANLAFDRRYPPTGVDNVRLLDSTGDDLVVNGSFEDQTGSTRRSFGFTAVGSIPGWFSDGDSGAEIFFGNRRFLDAFATDGSVYLDTVAVSSVPGGSNSVQLRQNFSGLTENETYRISIDVTASQESRIGVRLVWNGTPVSIDGETTLPIIEDLPLLSVTVPPGEAVNVGLGRHMLAYGDALQLRASGSSVDATASYVLSTQEFVETVTEPPPPPEEESTE